MSTEQAAFDNISPSEIAVLRMLIDKGTITMDDVSAVINEKKKEYVVSRHKYNIYTDSQGRWRTYYKEPGAPSSTRKTVVKHTQEELYCALFDLYMHKCVREFNWNLKT